MQQVSKAVQQSILQVCKTGTAERIWGASQQRLSKDGHRRPQFVDGIANNRGCVQVRWRFVENQAGKNMEHVIQIEHPSGDI